MASQWNDDLYPIPSIEKLKRLFVGKHLSHVPTPAAVVDRFLIQKNCTQMLEAIARLQLGFRPHVKTHKTTEITELQIGDSSSPVNLVASTVSEVEHLVDYLVRCKSQGRQVNVLYGVPLPPSQIHRLACIGKRLGPKSISIMIDHPDQLKALPSFLLVTGFPVELYIKVDTGYHRAGLNTVSSEFHRLVGTILEDIEPTGCAELRGFYSHAGHSYTGASSSIAMATLRQEIEGLEHAANLARRHASSTTGSAGKQYILSVGATPTTTSIQSIPWESGITEFNPDETEDAKLRACIQRVKMNHPIELHAGVYPILDMQQVATQAGRSALRYNSTLATSDIALTILAEVASVYPHRDSPEALISAGSLALGREPCKSYDGWGVVSTWGILSPALHEASEWQVGRISQEHGILTHLPHDARGSMELHVGQKIRIWPNHACIAGAGFGWYLVVDSSLPGDDGDQIVDVWVRWRGW